LEGKGCPRYPFARGEQEQLVRPTSVSFEISPPKEKASFTTVGDIDLMKNEKTKRKIVLILAEEIGLGDVFC
jgi:hypothetical protein